MFWWILLWVLLGLVGLLLAYVLLIIISSLFVNTKKEYQRESRYFRFLLNSSTWLASKILRIKLHVTGMEKLPKGRYDLGWELEGWLRVERGLMHEGFHKDDPEHFTRAWFAWANSIFAEFVIHAATR